MFASLTITAQTKTIAIHYNGNFVSPGETVEISASDYYGDLTWQNSSDGINWSNIPDVNSDSFSYVVDENTWFRAVVTDGDCEPYYSDELKIHTIILYDNVILTDTIETSLLSDSVEMSVGTYRYLWNETTAFFQVGDIIIGREGYGYMRKVVSVSQNANEWIAETDQATLEDVIKEIDMQDSLQIFLTEDGKASVNGKIVEIKNAYYHPGVSLNSKYNLLSLQDVPLISTNYFSATILDGSMDFNPVFHRGLNIDWNPLPSLEYFKMSVGGELNFNLDMEFKASAPYQESEEVQIFYVEVPVFDIGPIPVMAYIAINIGYETNLLITGTTEINLDSKTGLEVGVEYDNGWNNIYEKTFDFNSNLNWGGTADMDAKVYIRPEAGLKITGFASGYMDFDPYLRAEAGVQYPNYDWYYGLYGGFDVGIGCNVSVIGFNLVDYHHNFANYEWEIFSNSGTLENKPPYADFTFEQDMQYDGEGYRIIFTDITQNGASSYMWQFGDNENSLTQNPIHLFTHPGFYEIKLTANNCYGSHTTSKKIYIGSCAGAEEVVDGSGNIYNTIQVGTDCWLRENLKTINYNDGVEINLITDNSLWESSTTGAYCWYENNEGANKNVYGALYNFEAVNSGKLCPTGWHVASSIEWSDMADYLEDAPADKIREKGTTYWQSPNETSTNETNFSARAAGYRDAYGDFLNMRKLSSWWTSNLLVTDVAKSRTVWYHSNDFDYVTSSTTTNGFSVRCVKNDGAIPTTPIVESIPATEIALNSAIVEGTIVDDGGASITDKGFVWSTSEYPTIETNLGMVSEGSGSSDFLTNINGLTASTVYYYRTYATNSVGTSYGNHLGFTTIEGVQPCPGIPQITDADGNVYNTVLVGCDCWTEKNLITTSLNNAQPISTNLNNTDWENASTAAYAIYPNEQHPDISSDEQMKDEFGLLYNWYAANSEDICPDGWHVATNSDWQNLNSYVGINIGDKLKLDDELYWMSGGTYLNEANFSAKAAGKRDSNGEYTDIKSNANWWTSDFCDEDFALSRTVIYNESEFDETLYKNKNEGYSIRCVLDPKGQIVIPVVATYDATEIESSSAQVVGEIISDGFGTITERGFVWSTTSEDPDLENNTGMITAGTGEGEFTANIGGLSPNTTYYIKAYATNEVGTAYGKTTGFYTTDAVQPCLGIPIIYDVDGNAYPTVQIETQCWMAKNLRTSKYNDNSTITTALDNSQWSTTSEGAYSVYPYASVENIDSDEEMSENYGNLYNFEAINSGKLCPVGWHVSTNSEWQTLNAYLIENPADKLRETGTEYWISPNDGATNETGFNARGAGQRTSAGNYQNINNSAGFWTSSPYSSTIAFSWMLWNHSPDFDLTSTEDRKRGQSVRCVKDF